MRLFSFFLAFLLPLPAFALSVEAQEFMAIIEKLEPVQCEKRKLRHDLVLAEVEGRTADARKLRERFAALNQDPDTASMERRLAELQPRLERSSDPEDLRAINQQRVEALYRCE